MSKRRLPWLDEALVGRRPFVLASVSACVLTACGTVVQQSDGGEDTASLGDGFQHEGGVDGGVDADRGDAAALDGSDGAFDASHDAGFDAGTDARRDAGTDAARDAGTDVAHDSGPTCTPGVTRLGAVTGFAMGTWHLLTTLRVIVGHDAGGLYAYSAVCTHAGCVVDAPSSTGIAYCPCHGSRFNGNGAVVTGPAGTPLPHYQVTVCAGIAYVNRARTVAASTRTPP